MQDSQSLENYRFSALIICVAYQIEDREALSHGPAVPCSNSGLFHTVVSLPPVFWSCPVIDPIPSCSRAFGGLHYPGSE